MCLALYIGSTSSFETVSSDLFVLEPVLDDKAPVRAWFASPHVAFVGIPTCSCALAHVIAEEPIEWFEGMFEQSEDREEEIQAAAELLRLIGLALETSPEVEMYPVWNGDEKEPPKGIISLVHPAQDSARFFLNERFLYRVTGP